MKWWISHTRFLSLRFQSHLQSSSTIISIHNWSNWSIDDDLDWRKCFCSKILFMYLIDIHIFSLVSQQWWWWPLFDFKCHTLIHLAGGRSGQVAHYRPNKINKNPIQIPFYLFEWSATTKITKTTWLTFVCMNR